MKMFLQKTGLNSIQGRLTSIAFFSILVTALTIGVAGFTLTVNFESKRFHDHFSLLATYLASNAELGVLLGNEKALIRLTENMLAVTDVQVVEILDNNGQVLMKRSHRDLPAELASVSAQVVASPMEGNDSLFHDSEAGVEVLGRVNLAYSLTGLNQLKQLLAQRFLLASILLAFVPIFMYWLLSRAINAPLLSLLDVAGKVSRGQMNVRAARSSLKEINTLSKAFNEMLDAMEAQQRELNEANERMAKQRVLAEVGKFSMTVAHEIKDPLAIIKGSLDIFKKEGPNVTDIKKRMMGFVDEEIERINKLIEDFLLFARPRPPAFQTMQVNTLIDTLVQRIKLMEPRVRIDSEISEDEGKNELQADLFLLERALLNVVRNAVEESSRSESVEIEIACQGGSLIFTVLDDGHGIDPNDLNKIFEPFFSHKSKGTGLGLAIAKDAVNAHGGQIIANNRKQGGASFALSLPTLTFEAESHDQRGDDGTGAFSVLKENE